MTRLTAAAALFALAACEPVVPPDGLPDHDACGAAALQGLVGQPARVLETMRFSQPLRVIRPGQAVTMDYSAERLNIEINAAEIIARVTCG